MATPFKISLAMLVCVAASLLPTTWAADGVDTSPLPIKTVRSFPNLKPRRPVAITNAADGSNRLFIVSEQGQILAIKNDQSATDADVKTFLDIEPKVDYEDKENEEGLLGLAFHPKYKQNGEFFIHYTAKEPPHTTIISRVKVSKDPNQADAKTEEVLFTFTHPFWNHKGGNLAFGPDGYLYISLGDGGSANDPHGNGQNLKTPLGKLLRIDIDHKDPGLAYAIPKDNPFAGKGDGVRGEIYALGLRNVWGMSFDPITKLFYAADVGQNLWEEINIIEKGGNYGWSVRESFHKFDKTNPKVTTKTGPGRTPDLQNKPDAGDSKEFKDPIWEYHHDTDGKSITGGVVYRGKRLPDLVGYYIYADYVSGKIWGLKYDEKAKKVVANRPIAGPIVEGKPFNIPCMSIGADEAGEIYLGDSFGQLWWLESAK